MMRYSLWQLLYGAVSDAALWLYAALLLATMIWGVWKSGSTSGRSRRVAYHGVFRHLANIAVLSGIGWWFASSGAVAAGRGTAD